MFKFLTDSIDNALSVSSDILDCEPPKRREVAKLLADGLTVWAAAEAAGVAVEVVEAIAEQEDCQ